LEVAKLNLTKKTPILRIDGDQYQELEDEVIKEFQLTINLNGQQIVALACSSVYLEDLAIGYLFAEQLIEANDEIKQIERKADQMNITLKKEVDRNFDLAHKVVTSGCGNSIIHTDLEDAELDAVETDMQIEHKKIHQAMTELYSSADLFKKTGGVHSALLTDFTADFSVFREDIGRHNAVDKLVGHLISNQLPATDKILVVSGRISAEILLKVAQAQIPILVSRSAPTDRAIRLAYRFGITLIGFVRGERMNIYADQNRVK
jgi:FdhD protein